jgi:hypothetical protein
MVAKYFSIDHLFFQAFFHYSFLFSLFLIATKCSAQFFTESKREYRFHSHQTPGHPMIPFVLSIDFVYYYSEAACFFS